MNREEFDRLRRQYQQGCVFCAPADELVVATAPNFGVCLDVAPLAAGHLILHSAEHHACSGEVPRELFAELKTVKQAAVSALRRRYGSVTLYEHGRAGHCLTDGPEHRLCHHFHLHCVPTEVDVSDELATRFSSVQVSDYGQLTDLYEEYGDYLYVENADGEGVYFVVDRPIERHLLRTLISRAMGCPERADWKNYPSTELLERGMADLRAAPLALAPVATEVARVQA
jgi:diadenosine tetraphosphate (Ap4A) HIT family hydrolase